MILNNYLPALKKRSDGLLLRSCLVVILALYCHVALQAQSAHCHADELLQEHLHEANVQEELKVYKKFLKKVVPTRGPANQLDIPVVVHVIHDGESIGSGPNLPTSKILEQLNILNADFSLNNTDRMLIPPSFSGIAVDTEIQFCLAKEDENGNLTDGIIRHKMPNISSINYMENNVKPQTQWNPNKYMNIWILRMPDPSILGYAYLPVPSILGTDLDGIVISHLKVGNVGNSTKGRTLVHEVGHYLGLPHIWGFDENECNEDDQISDTPSTSAPYYGCPLFPQFTCGTSDMFMNYMDYVDDGCMQMFTGGQKAVMRNILFNQRLSLRSGANTICNSTVSAKTPEKDDNLMEIFPNPCQEVLNIRVPENQILGSLRIYSNQGDLIRDISTAAGLKSEIKIDTESLQNGIYIVRIETVSGESHFKRFICSN